MQQDIKKAVERQRNALSITAVAGEPTTLRVCLTFCTTTGFEVCLTFTRLSGQETLPIIFKQSSSGRGKKNEKLRHSVWEACKFFTSGL